MTHHPHRPEDLDRRREEARRLEQGRLVEEGEDVKWLMSSERGRRIVHDLLERAGVLFGDAMVDDGSFNPNAMTMARDAGRRSVVWRLDQMIRRHCNELWTVMRLEREKHASTRKHQ